MAESSKTGTAELPSDGEGFRRLDAEEIADYVRDVIFAADRSIPIVAITSMGARGPWIDPADLAREIGDRAEVVFIETDEATWALADALPPHLEVYGGAARIWWPGVHAESNMYDHPLLLIRCEADARRAHRRIIDEIRQHEAPAEESIPSEDAVPAVWERIGEGYHEGDIVIGHVTGIRPFGFFVELLPGAVGLVHISKIDWADVDDPADYVHPGERVAVKILALRPEIPRAELSLRDAYGQKPLAQLSLDDGEDVSPVAEQPEEGATTAEPDRDRPDFVEIVTVRKDKVTAPPEPASRREIDAEVYRLKRRVAELISELAAQPTRAELHSAQEQVSRLAKELASAVDDRKSLRAKVTGLRKDLRSAQDRLEHVEQHRLDPMASERAFLLGVRLAYADLCSEATRFDFPLKRMLVGRSFLERLQGLEGMSVEKVLEVCAQVASNRVKDIPGREVHPLRAGEGGAPQRLRSRDDAKAWRCSLKDATPGAPRLHWWSIPGNAGGTVEFASVGLHDDFSIPE
jgi:predicted RNA-binding protein with RPS1 domain